VGLLHFSGHPAGLIRRPWSVDLESGQSAVPLLCLAVPVGWLVSIIVEQANIAIVLETGHHRRLHVGSRATTWGRSSLWADPGPGRADWRIIVALPIALSPPGHPER
jgi:hypothetical protein